MSISFLSGLLRRAGADPQTGVAQMRDYGERALELGMRRLLIYAAALVLQAFYVGAEYVAISTILIILSEAFDGPTFQQARSLRTDNPATIGLVLRRIHMGALFNALMISFFALSIAFAASGGNSFVAMLYVLAATVFTAMNMHQLLSALLIRLLTYGATFLAIPLVEVLATGGPISFDSWFTVLMSLFVFYFIVDGAVIARRYHHTQRRQLAQLATLTDARLDDQMAEVGHMSFDFCDVQLARLISDSVADSQSRALERDITLKMLPVDTDIMVRADPMRLEQVIIHLLATAITFCDRGSEVILRVTATQDHTDITVTRRGLAITTASQTYVFNHLKQKDAIDSRKIDGSQMQFNTSKQIVEAHGGQLNFAPHDGEGEIFHVRLGRNLPTQVHPQQHLIKQPDTTQDQ